MPRVSWKSYANNPNIGKKYLKHPIKQHPWGFICFIGLLMIPFGWGGPSSSISSDIGALGVLPNVFSIFVGQLPPASFISYVLYYINQE